MAKPWERDWGTSSAPTATPIPESPQQREERRRQAEADARDNTRTGIAVEGSARDARGEQHKYSQDAYNNTIKLRNDFDAMPGVKEYRIALPQLAQGLKTGNTPQGDLALIYAYAKVMDPGSVVREGEAAAVANADSIAGQLVGRLRRELGEGQFRPEVREGLRREMIGKVNELNKAYTFQRQRYTEDARNFGIDPERVVGKHDGVPFLPQLKEYDERQKQMNILGGGDARLAPASGEEYSTAEDLALAKQIQAIINQGGTVEDVGRAMTESGRGYTTQQAIEWQRAINYRDSQGEYAGQKPAGMPQVTPPKSGRRGLVEQAWGDVAASPVGAAGIGAADAYTAGTLDELIGGISALGGGNYEAERDYANMTKNAAMQESPIASGIGNFVGGAAAGGSLAGITRSALPQFAPRLATAGGQALTGAGYGAAYGAGTENEDRLGGALMGAGIGAAGGLAGAGIGRGMEAIMRTAPMKNISTSARDVINRVRPNTVAPEPNIPALTPATRTIGGNMDMDAITATRANLRDAESYGLPYSLADADPRLRMLAGAATRRSPDARVLAEQAFDPRHLDQAARANDAIDQYLAPITDIAQRGGQWKEAAQIASSPYYAAGMTRAAPIDDRVKAFLNTTTGKKALKEAFAIAENEGRDPLGLGFNLNDQGEVVLENLPSWESLDLVKKGIDSQLAPFRNPMTGKLDLEGNPSAQALEGFRQRFIQTLDDINPDYKKARAAYEEQIRNRTALETGTKGPSNRVRPRDIPRITDGMDDIAKAEYRRGYATNLADSVNDTKLSGDPFGRIYGATSQREKIGSLFDKAPDFDRINQLEGDMAKTRYEALGGSPTAARLQADQAFSSDMGTMAIDAASQLGTGGGLSLGSIARAGLRPIADAAKFGIGKRGEHNATAIAERLFQTDPAAGRSAIDDYVRMMAEDMARKQDFVRRYGLFGTALTPALQPMINN